MVKVVIAEKRPFDFIGTDGSKITGYSYGGFLADGTVLTFTSQKDHEVSDSLGFDEQSAVELDIRPKFWGGTVKYRENSGK